MSDADASIHSGEEPVGPQVSTPVPVPAPVVPPPTPTVPTPVPAPSPVAPVTQTSANPAPEIRTNSPDLGLRSQTIDDQTSSESLSAILAVRNAAKADSFWSKVSAGFSVFAIFVFFFYLAYNGSSSAGDTSKKDDAVAYYMEIGKLSEATTIVEQDLELNHQQETDDIKNLVLKIDELADSATKGNVDLSVLTSLQKETDKLGAEVSQMQNAEASSADPQKLRQIAEDVAIIKQDLAKLEATSSPKPSGMAKINPL